MSYEPLPACDGSPTIYPTHTMPTCHEHKIKYATYGNCSECIKEQAVPKQSPPRFRYVNITSPGAPGTINLFWRDFPIQWINSPELAAEIKAHIDAQNEEPQTTEKQLASMTKERDRLRDVKWDGITKLEAEIARLREYIEHAQCLLNVAMSASENKDYPEQLSGE